MPEFVVDLVGRGDRLGDLGAETVAETLAESLDGLLDGFLGQIELRGDLGQRERVFVAPNIILEQVEERSAARGGVVGAGHSQPGAARSQLCLTCARQRAGVRLPDMPRITSGALPAGASWRRRIGADARA